MTKKKSHRRDTEDTKFTQRKHNSALRILCALCASVVNLIALSAVTFAQDWPGWRGPNRDGVVASFTAPKTWPESLKLKWKTPVGEGHSSPVVAGDRVYIQTRQGEEEVVSAIDLNTGKVIWSERNGVSYTVNPAAVGHGKGPKSTPVISGGKLYALSISGVLSSLDAQTGKLRWRKDFSKDFKVTSPLYGSAMSPLVVDNLVIAHVGGSEGGMLAAFNADTGEVKWSWRGDGPGYASPIIVDIGGARQIVTQSEKNLIAVSAATGELLWQMPFTTEYDQNIVTPVVYKDTLIFSGIDKGTFAIKPHMSGGKWKAEQVWHNPQVSMYMNTPVLVGDHLFGLSHKRKGQFFSLDARTGATVWTTEGREGENASLIAAGGLLFILNNDAELTVARKGATAFEPLKKYTVAQSPTWAHPVVVGNRLLIKDASTLALWGLE
ncbi:MAG TPA: PQQ-binding-like beta-propeller repeat protein [Blastocatellia bacterium]|nr:PQQ-binding-like beta-propeller repeat protein [Blastocatellia bacterium]